MNSMSQSEKLDRINNICESYRSSSVDIPVSLIQSGFKDYVTIKSEDCLRITLFDQTVKDNREASSEYVTINGNSFGPFFPDKYLEQELRIVALLKEDYIEHDSFYNKNDRGGHNKAEQFANFNYFENATYINLSRYVNSIIRKIDPHAFDGKSESSVFEEHVAIINVTPFPGLSIKKNSKGDYIKETSTKIEFWAKKSTEIIEEQIDLLSPSIVISGNVLRYYLSVPDFFMKVRENTLSPEQFGVVFNRQIQQAYISKAYPDTVIYIDEHYTIWLDDNHPSSFREREFEIHLEMISDEIKKLL